MVICDGTIRKKKHMEKQIQESASVSTSDWWKPTCFNPLEKNISQIGILPQIGVKIKQI